MWERWNSIRPDGSFGPVNMNSMNHYAFGAVCEWLYRWAAGINPTESAPGFKHSVLRPMPNSLLQSAKASVDTLHGPLSSKWELAEWQNNLPACGEYISQCFLDTNGR